MLTYQDGCPACSCKRSKEVEGFFNVRECKDCAAIYGHAGYKGDAYGLYSPRWSTAVDLPVEKLQHIDITFLGSNGMERFHGWIEKATKAIVQVG